LGIDIEKRQHKRYRYEAIISHDILAQESVPAGKTYNFSSSGLYFESNNAFYTGEEIFVEIIDHPRSSGTGLELLFDVEIVWHKKLQNSSFQYGYGAKFKYPAESIESTIGVGLAENRTRSLHNPVFKPQNEAREFPRKPFRKSLVFNYKNHSCRGLITNMSRGGVFIKTKANLSLGQKVKFVATASKFRRNVKRMGWVVRLTPEGFAVSFERRSGSERRYDLDRRIGIDRRKRGAPREPHRESR